MSVLNDMKKACANTPNDTDLGAFVRTYMKQHITCCDYSENRVSEEAVHPHNKREVSLVKCKVCNKFIF